MVVGKKFDNDPWESTLGLDEVTVRLWATNGTKWISALISDEYRNQRIINGHIGSTVKLRKECNLEIGGEGLKDDKDFP